MIHPLVMRCINDTDSGTAARVWRSPLSSTTPSTGIPTRQRRRRRVRSCLNLTPFSRDPRDRSTLRTLPSRESTYEYTRGLRRAQSSCRWCGLLLLLSVASLLCVQVAESVCRCNEPRKQNTPDIRTFTWTTLCSQVRPLELFVESLVCNSHCCLTRWTQGGHEHRMCEGWIASVLGLSREIRHWHPWHRFLILIELSYIPRDHISYIFRPKKKKKVFLHYL